ncbi:hypothetical protein CCICO_08390 [Corynebacterium ciconiae DSM 44920]|nr:hypothetical protein CCICO_08390 [Corynebacterium ciconiae DSM 44920]
MAHTTDPRAELFLEHARTEPEAALIATLGMIVYHPRSPRYVQSTERSLRLSPRSTTSSLPREVMKHEHTPVGSRT